MAVGALTLLTSSGKRISLIHPIDKVMIEDIAVALGRTPRFGGHTTQFWSVLHHSLVTEQIAANLGLDWVWRATCLAHDFHEAFTGDIPTPFKGSQIKSVQDKLDEIIYHELSIPFRYGDRLHEVDRLAMMAEGACYGPPGFVELTFGHSDVDVEHMNIVRRVAELNSDTINGLASEGVRNFLGVYQTVMRNAYDELGW